MSDAKFDSKRSRHSIESDSRARNESFQKHVAGTRAQSISARRWMQSSCNERLASFDLACNAFAEAALSSQRD